MLQDGTVPVRGSTGAMVGRCLRGMRDHINNALVGARLDSCLEQVHRVSVSALIGDAEIAASRGANAEGFELAVAPVAEDIDVEVDDQVLSTAIGILLQNAFELSCPHGHVTLRTTATTERVLIEIEDECGGLPPGQAEALSRPGGKTRDQGRRLDLGLTMSRMGVEAMGGTLAVRDLPDKVCVFSIDLPRLPAA
jgi:signal transduction histidine kinase